MSTAVNVARYHLVDRLQYLLLPCAITAFSFLVNAAIFVILGQAGVRASESYSGGLLVPFIFLFIAGAMSIMRSLPFGLALGLSRRSYYIGTVGFVVTLAAAFALAITVLQLIEGALGGWGMALHFFRVPWILDGPWYLTWLTSFVLLVLMFVYGLWFGLAYRRWSLLGLLTLIASQVVVLLGGAAVVTWLGAWTDLGSFFTTLSVLGVTGLAAVLAALLAIGGLATIRRVTI